MEKQFVEVNSALWQKLLAVMIFLIIGSAGMVCWLSPFLPIFRGPQPPDFLLFLMGAFLFALGLGPLWATLRYSIRADENGISHTNGFFRQSATWSEVQSYYTAVNPRFHKGRKRYVEPFLLNANGEVIFQGFEHIFVSTEAIFRQRQELWNFVEAHLEGKKTDAPISELDAEKIALRSMEIKWGEKSLLWKVGRLAALALYTLFWCSLSFGPMYYIISHNLTIPKPLASLFLLPMCIGPLLPHIIWLHFKKKRALRELKAREGEK